MKLGKCGFKNGNEDKHISLKIRISNLRFLCFDLLINVVEDLEGRWKKTKQLLYSGYKTSCGKSECTAIRRERMINE